MPETGRVFLSFQVCFAVSINHIVLWQTASVRCSNKKKPRAPQREREKRAVHRHSVTFHLNISDPMLEIVTSGEICTRLNMVMICMVRHKCAFGNAIPLAVVNNWKMDEIHSSHAQFLYYFPHSFASIFSKRIFLLIRFSWNIADRVNTVSAARESNNANCIY